LGDRQKTLIHALVREHISESDSFDDVIKGKGRGLIGLLAGTPGCGKTLTAEAVAETTRRPLYAVSAGELGTTPEEVEERLMLVLELAQMWNAVLLLDEAEVFLQQRDVSNVERNALVSIFLRQLEYYQGILILTTNMPEQCDAAFESKLPASPVYLPFDKSNFLLV
jgi:SpoVK/Ycf46/Vps4 family AAA+-type ATPase